MGADLLSIDWGKAHMHGEFLLVMFNRRHRVTASSFARWSNDAGGGQAIQPMLRAGQHGGCRGTWLTTCPSTSGGATLLSPLPEAINSGSRPDMGQSGIQRRGTPTGSGQQTLE